MLVEVPLFGRRRTHLSVPEAHERAELAKVTTLPLETRMGMIVRSP